LTPIFSVQGALFLIVLPPKTGRFPSGLVVRMMMSSQFFLGLPGLHFLLFASQYMACFGNLLSSIRKTCPKHRSLLSSMVRLNICSVVVSLISSFRTLSLHEMPSNLSVVGTCGVPLPSSNFFLCVTDRGHNSRLLTSPAIHS